MNSRRNLNRLAMTAVGLFAVAGPTYSHWGAGAPWTTVGQSHNCTHGSSTNADYRRVKVQTIDIGFTNCVEILGCYWYSFGLDAQVTNTTPSGKSNSGKADIILSGFDGNNPPGSFLPYLTTINDLPRNSTSTLSSAIGKLFTPTLQSSCQTSDNGL